MALIPGQIIHNRYKVIALLTTGGMSAVFEVTDTTLNIRCALKEMRPYPGTRASALPQLREQFQQEALLLAELRHPNLTRVTDHFEEDGNVYLVMDYVYGRRLDEVVTRNEGLPEDTVLDWAEQLIEALAYCHEEGVIHRDVKPQNVIVTSRGRVVLVDFGLAKLVDPDNPRTRTVMRGIGTPEYAPPEQYDTKEGRTDARTDIYSLGATLYHALVGEPPPMLAERVVDPGSLIPVHEFRDDISLPVSHALVKSMELQPARRFQNLAEMYHALFGSPQHMEMEGAAPYQDGATLAIDPSGTVMLQPQAGIVPWLLNHRVGVAVAVIALVAALLLVISPVIGGIGAWGAFTPTLTPTPTVSFTMTPTRTLPATRTFTETPTATSTARPTVPQATKTPEEVESLQSSGTRLPTRTPTRVYVPSTNTPTLTSTPTPAPSATPKPRTSTPAPTNTPVPVTPDTPTNTPVPTLIPTVPPTFTPFLSTDMPTTPD